MFHQNLSNDFRCKKLSPISGPTEPSSPPIATCILRAMPSFSVSSAGVLRTGPDAAVPSAEHRAAPCSADAEGVPPNGAARPAGSTGTSRRVHGPSGDVALARPTRYMHTVSCGPVALPIGHV